MRAMNQSQATSALAEATSSRYYRMSLTWLLVSVPVLISTLLVLLSTSPSDAQSPPLTYNAISDRNVYPNPTLPSLGGAGYQFTEPTFGSKMLRVTDGNTRPDRAGRAWSTPSSSETSAWNADGTKFYVTGGGGEQLPYNFNPATMTVSRMGDTSNASGGLVLLLDGEPSFSFVDPDLIYGGSGSQIISYRFSTATQTALHDVRSCLPGVAVHGFNMSVTKDDQRLLVYVGGSSQDLDTYVYVYDRTVGCRWLNTQTGQVGGQWGLTGPYTGDSGFSIHNVRISKNGKWARITAAGNSLAGIYFWNIETLAMIPCNTSAPPYCGGHVVTGYNLFVNNPGIGDGVSYTTRPMATPSAMTNLIAPLLTPAQYFLDGHPTWNNVLSDEAQPFCTALFRDDNLIQRPWDGEVICIRTDLVASTVWRFAHHRSTQLEFGDTPRANISQTGRALIFTSNWEGTLGSNRDEPSGLRWDVFLVQLAPSNTTLPAAPTNLTVH